MLSTNAFDFQIVKDFFLQVIHTSEASFSCSLTSPTPSLLISENLELADSLKMITHPEVGKYFKEFKGTHYYPNDEKLAQYPQDMPMTLQFCQDKYGS